MRNSQLFSLAGRYTLAPGSAYLSSVLSLLSMLGLVLAIALLILVLSVMNGFDREMRENILGLVPQLTIRAWGPLDEIEQTATILREHPSVVAVSPFIELQGMLVNGRLVDTVMVFGISGDAEEAAGKLPDVLNEQHWTHFRDDADGLILGAALARRLQLDVGDRTTLIVPGTAMDARSARYQHLRVSGLINSGTELDESAAFLHLQRGAQLLGRPGQIDGYRLRLDDLFLAPRVGWDLINTLPPTFYARDWTQTHGNLYAAVQMSRNLVGLLLLSIIAIAAFNVVSSLVLVVVDKRSDIAILRALGASPGDISGIFLRQGVLIALVGMGLGTLLGVLASAGVTDIVAGIEQLLGIQFLDTDVYPIGYLPADLRLSDVVMINAVACLLCFIAALYPARRAARLPPADALRHE